MVSTHPCHGCDPSSILGTGVNLLRSNRYLFSFARESNEGTEFDSLQLDRGELKATKISIIFTVGTGGSFINKINN